MELDPLAEDRKDCVFMYDLTAHNSAFVQLVYKVKLDFVLEQLASASVGGYGQDVWSELVEEAKTNLMKITVSVTLLCL